MTTNLTLRKVSDDLYEDDSATAYAKWTRGLRRVELDLFDLSAVQGVELGFKELRDPLTDISAARIRGIAMGQQVDRDWVRGEAYVCARGHIAERDKSLLLINPCKGEAASFCEFSVTIRPASVTSGAMENQDDFEKVLGGHWGHIERESRVDLESYLWLDLPAPEVGFRPIWRRLIAGGSFARVSVGVLVEAFESELCRTVHFDDTDLAFERGAYQRAFLVRLAAHTPTVLTRRAINDSNGGSDFDE